jgi:hypothetical protein
VRKLTRKVITGSADTPQRRNAQRLSNTVESLLVTNELMRADLLQVKEALKSKPTRSRKKLVGTGVFSVSELKKMKEEKDQKGIKRKGVRTRSQATQQATELIELSEDNDAEDEEHWPAVEVAIYQNLGDS